MLPIADILLMDHNPEDVVLILRGLRTKRTKS
jgi:hypothetical protein